MGAFIFIFCADFVFDFTHQKAATTATSDFRHSHFDFAAVSRLYVGLVYIIYNVLQFS